MIKSMTGFGKACAELPGKKIRIEIKTLNSKSLNLAVKLPDAYREKEADIRNIVSLALERGKIEVIIKTELHEGTTKVSVNESVVNAYYDILEKMAKAKGHSVHDEQIFQIIMRLPEVFGTEEPEVNEEEWEKIRQTLSEAIKDLDDFRIREGLSQQLDLLEKIDKIEALEQSIAPFEEERISKLRERLSKRLEEAFEADNGDKNRFEQEIIYYLEKFDINEEKVRLRNHTLFFKQTIDKDKTPGKKLGFIAQEIGREINTLGAKANHSEIQKIVVEMKDELEKIKEQVLNIL